MDYKDNSKAKIKVANRKGFSADNELYEKDKKRLENYYMIINGVKIKTF
jgi:hypothetical protein